MTRSVSPKAGQVLSARFRVSQRPNQSPGRRLACTIAHFHSYWMKTGKRLIESARRFKRIRLEVRRFWLVNLCAEPNACCIRTRLGAPQETLILLA
jgi:hypothetical protein